MIRIETPTTAITDAAVEKQTGKSLKDWFAAIDKFGGAEKGRRAVTQFLYGQEGMDDWWMNTVAVEHENARGILEKDGRPKGYSLCATKTVNMPLSKAFAAWTTAKAVEPWLGNKPQWDFKAGGRYQTADGDLGEFLKVRPDKAIKFTWEAPDLGTGTVVEVLFQAKAADKTTIMVNHTRIADRHEADVLRASWGSALDKLKAILERG